MLPTRTPNTSPRDAESYTHTETHSQTMNRSGSILSTIKSIVSAPLSWFASNEEDIEDLNGKRKRIGGSNRSDDGEEAEGSMKSKRMRMDSPERTTVGYLDPPPATFNSSIPAGKSTSSNSVRPSRPPPAGASMRSRTSVVATPSTGLSRTMSENPSTFQYTAYRPERSLQSTLASDGIRYSMPLSAREHDQAPSTPFRLRTSLAPQVSPSRSLRREASAPPPLSTLESRPKFVKPPPLDKSQQNKPLSSQKTLSLASYAEFQRQSKSPTRDRMLFGVGSMVSEHSDASMASVPSTSSASKIFHELETFKRPIIPSRYRDAQSIPDFLKTKKAHVPIPLPRKERAAKPSLGLADTVKKAKYGGKPYAGQGGMSKLLAKRKAELAEEGSGASESREEDLMDDSIDGDVSRITDVSDMEGDAARVPSEKLASTLAMLHEDDPFTRPPAGREQPFGRIGRIKQSRREPSVRSSKFGRSAVAQQSNKFSAAFDDEDAADESMDTADDEGTKERESKSTPTFSAPEGFSFANTATQIQHDHSSAKEPPISTLPFSFAKPTSSIADSQAKRADAPTEKAPVAPLFAGTSAANPPAPTREAPSTSTALGADTQSSQPAQAPPAPAASAFSFAAPPSSSSGVTVPAASSASGSSGIPNFFSSSPLLVNASKPPTIPQVPTNLFGGSSSAESSSPFKPVKDPENPLWNGDAGGKKDEAIAAPSTTPASTAKSSLNLFASKPAETELSKPAEPKPSPFGGFSRPSAWPPVQNKPDSSAASSVQGETSNGSLPIFGATGLKAADGVPSSSAFGATNGSANANAASPAVVNMFGTTTATAGSSFSAASKPAEPAKPPTSTSMFTFGQPAGNASKENIAPANSDKTAAASNATQSATTVEAPKTSLFSFGAPPSINGTVATSATSAAKSSTNTEQKFSFGAPATSTPSMASSKTPFSFGATPATPTGGAAEPKGFSFGSSTATATATTASPFAFGTPPATSAGLSATTPAEPAPFSFGAPAPPRPTTPPNKDKEERMEESPTRMEENGKSGSKLPANSFFGASLSTSFSTGAAGSSTTGSPFSFGATTSSNPFAPKAEEAKQATSTTPSFSFGRTASAPVVTTSFSFGQKSDGGTTPTSAFGAPPNLFAPTPVTPTAAITPAAPSSSGFSFNTPTSSTAPNPFASAASQVGSAPSSPFQTAPSFTFTAATPPVTSSGPFHFGASQPSSPATSVSGLPQSPSIASTTTAPMFTFGAGSGGSDASAASGGSTGGNLFNIGAAPPQAANTPRRIKNLPRRGATGGKR